MPRTAAFYDLDGTLLHGSVVDHYLYFAKTDPLLPERVRRLALTVLKAPYLRYVDSLDRRRFNEEFYRSYRGLSEDRLAILGEALFEKVLKRKIYTGMQELLENDPRVDDGMPMQEPRCEPLKPFKVISISFDNLKLPFACSTENIFGKVFMIILN